MPTTVVITQTLRGRDAGELFHALLGEVDILASGLIQVIEDANAPIYLNRIQVSPEIVRYSCGFNPLGSITLTEKKLIIEKYKIEMEICKEDFRSSSIGSQFGASAWNKNASKDLNDAIKAHCIYESKSKIADWIWNGKKTEDKQFSGYFELFAADSEVIKVTGTVAPTAENVTSIFELIKKSFTKQMRDSKMVKGLFVSSDIYDAYESLLIGKGIQNGLGGDANTTMKYGKIEIHEMTVFPANTAVFTLDKNLVFGTGLLQDYNEFRIQDMDEVDLTGTVRYKMVFGAGCEYVFGGDIIWYNGPETNEEEGEGIDGFAGRPSGMETMNFKVQEPASSPVQEPLKKESSKSESNEKPKTAVEVISEIEQIENIEELEMYSGDIRQTVKTAVSKQFAKLNADGNSGSGEEDELDKLVEEAGK